MKRFKHWLLMTGLVAMVFLAQTTSGQAASSETETPDLSGYEQVLRDAKDHEATDEAVRDMLDGLSAADKRGLWAAIKAKSRTSTTSW